MAINSLGASSYGLSGLVSGMNSQEMVEKLLSGTQSKIDKATQRKTVLQYKQNMYREVTAKLKALQSSYLSFTSKTNLLSNAFYNTMTTNIKPPANTSAAFSVSASSDARVGNTTMQYIKQLATARTEKTNVDASAGVQGTMNQDAAKQLLNSYMGTDAKLTIKVGNKSVSILNAPLEFSGKSQSEVADYLNDLFQNPANNIAAEARFVNNKLQIIADNDEDYVVVQGNQNANAKNPGLAMQMFGSGLTSLSGKGTFEYSIDTDNYLPSFEMNLDGRQQTIRMDLNALKKYANSGDSDDLVADINKQLKRAFGEGVKATINGSGNLEFTPGATSQKFMITGGTGVMGTLGLKTGISNKLNTNMALKDLNFAVELQGSQQTFKINGVQFSYSSNTSLSTIINDVNNSKAGVKISYSESEDRFVVQSAETGKGTVEFEVEQSVGNLMSVLFGERGGGTVSGYGVNVEMVGDVVDVADIENGGAFTFMVNGSEMKFTMSRNQYQAKFTHETFAEAMNDAFKDTFGYMADGTQSVEFLTEGGRFIIRANNKENVVTATKYHVDNNTNMLGFEKDQSTLATNPTTTLKDAGIVFGQNSGIKITYGTGASDYIELKAGVDFDEDTSMEDLAQLLDSALAAEFGAAPRPSVSFDAKTGAFQMKQGILEDDGSGNMVPKAVTMELLAGDGTVTYDGSGNVVTDTRSYNLENLFGQMSLSAGVAPSLPGGVSEFRTVTDEGQNAIFMLNGSEMERASNTFTVDGLTFTLHDTLAYTPAVGNPGDPGYEPPKYNNATTVTTSRDTEKIVEGVQEFLKMYNETMDYLYGLFKSDATYKDYAPLTSAQKADMSENEITLWEEKSKEGLLRNDPLLERVISSMRKAMYTKPEGSSIAIYDLGITTSFYTSDGNLNADSIDNLKAAIEQDPEALRQLFAGEGGIMELLNDVINDATKSSYGSPGYLTQMAGSNALDTTSSIYNQIKEIDDQLSTLETRYWAEYNRYWKQFNSMEQMISQMNSQSSWLSQQFG